MTARTVVCLTRHEAPGGDGEKSIRSERPKMKNMMKSFWREESGAVTVDWVLLTAAIALAGAVGVSTVQSKVSAKSESITL
jgi:Flp pilus assembly pilin Flp